MSQPDIWVYSLRNEDEDNGFSLVATEKEIDVENAASEWVSVNNLILQKGKGYNFLLAKKNDYVKLDKLVSQVDNDLFQYTSKAKKFTFSEKDYETLVSQIKDDLEEDAKQSQKKVDPPAKDKAVPAKDDKTKKSVASQSKSNKKGKQNEDEGSNTEEAEDEEKEKPNSKSKEKKKPQPKGKQAKQQQKQDEEDEEEESESESLKGKTNQKKGKQPAKKGKKNKSPEKDEEEEEDEDEDIEKEQPKKGGRKQAQKSKKTKSPEKEEDDEEEEEEEEDEEEEIPKTKKGKNEKQKNARKNIKKSKAQQEDEEDEDDEEDEEEEKPRKQGKKKNAKSGQSNTNIKKIVEVDDTFEGESSEIQENCCSFCTNRELIRAINTGNHSLLKKLINSKSKISTLFAKRGPDSDQTTLELILINKDKKALDIFLEGLIKAKDLQLASIPECSLDEVQTGYNDIYAYGAPTRKVRCSRGNKEGNNAFVADLNAFVSTNDWSSNTRLIAGILENEADVDHLEYLKGLKNIPISDSLVEKFYLAVRAGNRKTAGYLIAQANKQGGFGFNKVHEEVLTLNNASKMEEFRKVSATKKSQGAFTMNEYGGRSQQGVITPIHCAAINPNPDFIKKLLEIAPEFSIADDILRKPVHYAAACEGPGPLNYLIKQGVDTREGDKKKITPLMIACQYGRAKNLEVLFKCNGKSNPEAKTRESMRPIHFAAYYGHLDCIKLLVEQGGADIDSPGIKKMTSLHISAARGHFEIVQYLLDNGCNLNSKDNFRRTPVILATANGQLKILSLLLKRGGEFNGQDSSNNTPVHYAAAGGFQNCLDLLKLAGANLNTLNAWNLSPLSVAMAKGHFGMVKKLLNYPECDVNCTDVEGRTIISRATQNLNESSLIQFEFILKEKKANPNVGDKKGQSPLHYLCGLSKSKFVAKRQKEENKHNITEKYEQEYQQIVEKAIKILLEYGADVNQLNNLEQSPINIAIQEKNFFVLNILLNHKGVKYGFVNQIDQNIFHLLKTLIVEGISGIEQFHEIFSKIKKDQNMNVKQMLNTVDYNGFTPLLTYVKEFSQGAKQYWDNKYNRLKQELFEKKGVVKKDEKKNKASKNTNFGSDGSLIQLTESELEKIKIQANEDLYQYEHSFEKLILFLKSEGADVNATVSKIKKFRNQMDVEIEIKHKNKEEEEEDENEDEDDEEKEEQVKLKYSPEYCCYGECNIFALALNHLGLAYLKFFIDNFPQLAKGIDYLGRNILSRFIAWNNDSLQSKDLTQRNPLEVFKWLCTLEIDLNHKDMAQQTPLIASIILNRQNFAKTLVDFKADLQVKDFFGNTPLIMAVNKVASSDLSFVSYLLEHGADPNFTDNEKRTPLHHAVNRADKGANASFDLENLLLEFKANVNAVDSLGRTPLHYAYVSLDNESYFDDEYDPFETVSSLCNSPGIDMDAKDNFGKTPLHYASQKNSTISVIYMLEKGAKIDEEDIYGNSPLAIAFRFQRSEMTTTLIQKAADTSKMINILIEKDKEKKKEKKEQEQVQNHMKKRVRHYNRYMRSYGSRTLNKFGDEDNQQDDNEESEDNIISQLLKQEIFTEDPFLKVMSDLKEKEAQLEKGKGKAIFLDFNENDFLKEGKHSFFKAAISYQWQGIAYLLLIKSSYNLFSALEDAINLDLYQLSITLLNKYPNDKSIMNTNALKQNLLHILCKRPCKDKILQIKLLETLLKKKVDILQLDIEQNLPLHYAANYYHLTPRILELSPKSNQINKEENTPFSIAIKKDPKKALVIFSAYKPNLQQKFKAQPSGFNSKLYYTPFIFLIANQTKDLEVLQSFVDAGSDVNETDELNRNSLYYGIYHNSEKLVKLLLQYKNFDVNHIDSLGKNAVHYAVNPIEFGSYENKQILQILKEKGFNLDIKDNSGKTPMDYALLQDSKVMLEQLKNFGVSQQAATKKNLPQRAATSIVDSADFPEEEVDFEEDSKKFCEDAQYDKFKEFYEQRNSGEKVQLDKYVDRKYRTKENYVICDDKNEPYNLLMTKVDLAFGGYSKYVFYITQIIFDKNSQVYILYTRWGQIGQMGQMQHTPFPTKEAAIKEFSKIFSQKSGNNWNNRHQFKKVEKKYQLVAFNNKNTKKAFSVKPYDFDNMKVVPTTLDNPIFDFISSISNAEIFKNAFRIESVSDYYLPLTKLSKATLMKAYDILAELSNEVVETTTLRQKLTEKNNLQKLLEKEEQMIRKSNQYYELIPRAVSQWEPIAPLNDADTIQSEQRVVESLLDLEAAIKIIMGSYTKIKIEHPIDYCFHSLNIRMKNLEKLHPEYQMILQYTGRTYPTVLQDNSQIIRNIFAVERRGEAERIKQFQGYTKKLLWHGSGVQNFLSILSFGLRIRGIKAQQTGNSLGDGIYFADIYQKAQTYANNNGVGVKSRFLLLCEVALGKEQQIKTNEHLEKFQTKAFQLQKGFNSIKLVGNSCPDEKKNLILANGTIAPIGNIIDYNDTLKEKLKSKVVQSKSDKLSSKKQIKGKKQEAENEEVNSQGTEEIILEPQSNQTQEINEEEEEENQDAYQDDNDEEEEGEGEEEDEEEDNEENEDEDNEENEDEEDEENENEDEDEEGNENENEDEEGEENEEEEEDEEQYDTDSQIINNILDNVPTQKKKVPFNQIFTAFKYSEYVVYNPAQVRIRYIVEIRDK